MNKKEKSVWTSYQDELKGRLAVQKIINKYRIVERKSRIYGGDKDTLFVIQKKNFWGQWKDYSTPSHTQTYLIYKNALNAYWTLVKEACATKTTFTVDTPVPTGSGLGHSRLFPTEDHIDTMVKQYKQHEKDARDK